ncbi:hypothetical protein N9014_00360 [bacterium]|nr:hypothetical protein [bacterium]
MSKQTDLINIPDVITVSGAVVTESASASTVEHTINNETSSGNRYSMITFKDQGTNKYYQYQNHNDGHVLIRNEHATGSLQFMTGGANERIRIDSDGLKFHGDTAAANALNDYEEGTWTAVDGSGNAYNAGANATYTKIGRIVYINFDVSSTASTAGYQIAGLPFTASPNSVTANWSVYGGYSTSHADLWGHINASSNVIGMFAGSGAHTLSGRWIGAGFYYTEQ